MPADEVQCFTRYLIGGEPPAGVAERYALALEKLGLRGGSAALDFARRRPWALGPLDAACALLRPDDVLRRRLLALAAILETTPQCAPRFMPRVASPVGFAAGFLLLGMIATFRLSAGLVLWPFVRGARAAAGDAGR